MFWQCLELTNTREEIRGNRRKSKDIRENRRKSEEIRENQRKSENIRGNRSNQRDCQLEMSKKAKKKPHLELSLGLKKIINCLSLFCVFFKFACLDPVANAVTLEQKCSISTSINESTDNTLLSPLIHGLSPALVV